MTRPLLISFSGGRTSAYMTHLLLETLPAGREAVVVFANTGQEHEATLRFVDACDRHFGFNVVWVEAEVHPKRGAGTKFRAVDFNTASRDGRPFEAVIQKYGIPNNNYPHCTRELKERPIHAFVRSLGWKSGAYDTAIGIRVDEIDRMSDRAHEMGWVYPLVRWGVRKEDVLAWWKAQPFDLELPEHLGNCTWCWKKSLRKHLTLMQEHPEVFDFPRRMERLYPDAGPGDIDRPRRFFRKNLTTDDLFLASQEPFHAFNDPNFDLPTGCGGHESCEAFQ